MKSCRTLLVASMFAMAGIAFSPNSIQAQPSSNRSAPDPIARAYAELGKELYYAHELDAAIDNLQKSLKRAPGVGEVHMILGLALKEKRSYSEAENNFRKALNDPRLQKQRAHTALGLMYGELGDFRKAEPEFRRAYELDRSYPWYANNLAYTYARLGKNLDEALRLVNSALEAVTPPDAKLALADPTRGFFLDTRAWVYYRAAKYADAERDALEAISFAERLKVGSAAGRRYLLGEIYLSTQRRTQAKVEFEKVLKLDAAHKEAAAALTKL